MSKEDYGGLDLMNFVNEQQLDAKYSNEIEHEGVRITPSHIKFIDVREGQVYEKVLTIINRGCRSAVIRIKHPKSFAFTIKPIERGKILSPGLSVRRQVTYSYSKGTTIPYAEIPIFINDKLFYYPLFVTTSNLEIQAIPSELEFGKINILSLSKAKTVIVRNLSGNAVRFVIDLYVCQELITVEPPRGVIKPKQEVTLTVQLMLPEPGFYNLEFWIKCSNPVCIKVKSEVIIPRFHLIFPIPANACMTLLDFGMTYFGSSINKTVMLRNSSAQKTMFCITSEYEKQDFVLQQVISYIPDIGAFKCNPSSGRFGPMEHKCITLRFAPTKPTYEKNRLNVKKYFHWVQFTEVEFQDLSTSKREPAVVEKEPDLKNPPLSSMSLLSAVAANPEEVFQYSNSAVPLIETTRTVKAFLYAEAYTADVEILPSEIFLKDLHLMDSITRVVNMRNKNPHIPIYFEFKATAFINIKPPKGKIKAGGQLDLLVNIKVFEPGEIKTAIKFDLLYPHFPISDSEPLQLVGHAKVKVFIVSDVAKKNPVPKINHGITPVLTNEVGYLPEEVTFNTTIHLPKHVVLDGFKSIDKTSDIIAFPNDMPKSLRPRRQLTKRCTTVFAKIPRTIADWDDYDMPEDEKRRKEAAATYINMFIDKRKNAIEQIRLKALNEEKQKKKLDYDLTDKKKLLLLDQSKDSSNALPSVMSYKNPDLLPMTPEQLYYIKIFPRKLLINQILVDSQIFEKITIRNLNNFTVSIYINPLKNCLTVIGGNRRMLNKNSSLDIELKFNAPSKSGQVFVAIEIIVNGSYFCSIDFTAQVVEMMIQLDLNEVLFRHVEKYKVITLTNSVHAKAYFKWKINSSCFRIVPVNGAIPPTKSLKCAVYKQICENVCNDTEAQLNFELCPTYRTVSVNVRNVPFNVFLLNNNLHVPDIPLNLTTKKSFIVRNSDDNCVSYSVTGYEHIPGLTIFPESGLIPGKADHTIDVSFKFDTIVELNCILVITVGSQVELKLEIIGNIVYPDYIITPNLITFKKIPCQATECIPFVIENRCICRSKFQFPFDSMPDYTIRESSEFDSAIIPEEGFFLSSKQKRKLFLFLTPTTVSSVKFYLPITVNDMLGPVAMNVPQSRNTSYFMEKRKYLYVSICDLNIVNDANELPTLMVNSMVAQVIIDFSKMSFTFEAYPINLSQSYKVDSLTITNLSENQDEICIRIDDIKSDFYLEYSGGDVEIETYINSVSAILDPGNKIIFDVMCMPSTKFEKINSAPVFSRNYEKGPLFSYLSFNYIYHQSTIRAEEEIVYFPIVPPSCGIGKMTNLELMYHLDGCTVTAECDMEDLIITMGDKTRINENIETIAVTLFIYFKACAIVYTTIGFSCSCGASFQLRVKGCAENCLFSLHAFLKVYIHSPEENIQTKEHILDEQENENDTCTDTYCVYLGKRFDLCDYCCPLFPNEKSKTKYSEHMKQIILLVEEIVFTQGFNSEKYLKIPEGFSSMPLKKPLGKKDDKKKSNILFYEQFLMNMLGKQAANLWCAKKSIPENETQRVNYVYDTYTKALNFLKSRGGTFPFISVEYLLNYEDYIIFINEIGTKSKNSINLELKTPYNEQEFYLRSKQSWLDLLLQTYKVLVLFQIDALPVLPEFLDISSEVDLDKVSSLDTDSYVPTIQSMTHTLDYTNQDVFNIDDISKLEKSIADNEISVTITSSPTSSNEMLTSKSELIILRWLEKCYNTQIARMWKFKPDGQHLKERRVTNFNENFSDSLTILATISLYCPYFDNRLDDIYFCVENLETKHHNAIVMLEWLKEIKAVVCIHPEEVISSSSGIQMLFLTTYLFHFLPNLYPQKIIVMETNINKKVSRLITIQNNDKETIKYTVRLFENDFNCFTLTRQEFTIPTKKAAKIKINFEAKLTRTVNAYLLFNGESDGYRFAKCIPFKLEGVTKFELCTTTITLPIQIYGSVEVNLPVQSPYKTRTTYQIYCSIGKAETSNDVKLISWKLNRFLPILPCRINSDFEEVKSDNSGVVLLDFKAYCFSEIMRTYTIFFKSLDVGDFCVELRLQPDPSKTPRSVLYLEMNEISLTKLLNGKCKCGVKSHISNHHATSSKIRDCPKLVKLSIPRQNDHLWNGVGKMFRIVIAGLKNWDDDYATSTQIGAKLLYFAVDSVNPEWRGDMVQLYKHDVDYIVYCNGSTISMPDRIFIEDVRKIKENIDVFIHVNEKKVKNFSFTLTSEDLMEKRHYDVIWKLPPAVAVLSKLELDST